MQKAFKILCRIYAIILYKIIQYITKVMSRPILNSSKEDCQKFFEDIFTDVYHDE